MNSSKCRLIKSSSTRTWWNIDISLWSYAWWEIAALDLCTSFNVINFCQDYGISMSLYIQVFRLSGNCQAFPRFHAFRFSRLSGLTIVRLTSAEKILVRLTAVRILGCQENSWQHITENYTWQQFVRNHSKTACKSFDHRFLLSFCF